MPQLLVAVVAAAATYGATAAATYLGATTALAAFIGTVVGAVVAFAGSAIVASNAAKPDTQRNAADAKQMVRSSVEPRRVVYGRARVSGPIVYACSAGYEKGNLHLVVPVAGHTTAGWDGVFLNDDFIPREWVGSGFVPGAFSGAGALGQALASGPGSGTPAGANDVGFGPYAGKVLVFPYDGRQTAADAVLMSQSPDGWGPSDILRGVSYFHVLLRFDQDLFRFGVPNFSALMRGKDDIWDPRSGTFGWTDNWALVILDYLRSPFGLACSDDEIDVASFIAAANISDEWVQLDEGATQFQRRYTLNGTFQLDRTPIEIIEEMVAAGGGALVYVQGRYRLYAGAYVAPVTTVTPSDMAGPIEVIPTPPRRDRFNAVRGTFIDPAQGWQAAEFPKLVLVSAVAEDGEEIVRDVEFQWIKDVLQAQRIAVQMLKRHRDSLTVRVPLRYASLDLAVMDTIALDFPDFGWSGKPFRIIAYTFEPETGIITVTLQEEQPAAYAWLWSEAAAQPVYPDTTLVSPFNIPAPAGLSVNEDLYATRDGAGVRTKALLTWSPIENAFVTGYDIEFRPLVSNSVWRASPGTIGNVGAGEVLDLDEGLHEFRVRARTSSGAGAWVSAEKTIGGLAALPPADVTDFQGQVSGGMLWVRWTQHPDLDVRAGGRIEFRHHPETGGSWANATSIGEAAPGGANFAVLPLRGGRYFAKAVDAGGRYSANAASFFATQDGQFAYANVVTRTIDPTFPGVLTNAVVVDSTLRLVSLGDFDAIADFDLVESLDALGGIASSGNLFVSAPGLDPGAIKHLRVTPTLRAAVVNTLDQWDSRSGDFDSWASVDGVVGGEADAWFEIRHTLSTPPTGDYSAWQRLDGAEFYARHFQVRIQLRSYDPAFNIHIDQARVSADEVA